MDQFLDDIGNHPRTRVPGTAVFMTSEVRGVPVVLLHHLKHNKVLHETVILMSVRSAEVPETGRHERVSIEALGHGFFRVIGTYGFMESPDVKEILQRSSLGHELLPRPRTAHPAQRPVEEGRAVHEHLPEEDLRRDVAQRAQRHGILPATAQ